MKHGENIPTEDHAFLLEQRRKYAADAREALRIYRQFVEPKNEKALLDLVNQALQEIY